MSHIDTLLSRTSPLTEYEAILLASECKMLLERAVLCAYASAENTRERSADMYAILDGIKGALDLMPNIDHWQEHADISRLTGE